MRTGKTVLVYMDKRENGVTKNGICICGYTREQAFTRSLIQTKEDHIMDLILLAGVAVIDLLVVLCVKRMCEFVYKNINK